MVWHVSMEYEIEHDGKLWYSIKWQCFRSHFKVTRRLIGFWLAPALASPVWPLRMVRGKCTANKSMSRRDICEASQQMLINTEIDFIFSGASSEVHRRFLFTLWLHRIPSSMAKCHRKKFIGESSMASHSNQLVMDLWNVAKVACFLLLLPPPLPRNTRRDTVTHDSGRTVDHTPSN